MEVVKMIKGAFDQELSIGDVISYPGRSGSSL